MSVRLERGAFGALVLLALFFPFEFVKSPWRPTSWLTVTNLEVLLWLALGLWGIAALARGRVAWPRPLTWGLLLWLVVGLISAWLAPSHRLDALKFMARTTQAVLLGLATYDLAHTPARRARLFAGLALAGVVVGGLGLGEALPWPALDEWLLRFKHAPTRVGELVRVSSTLVYATIASMVLELAAPLVLAWVALWRGPRLGRGLWALGAGVVLTAQVLTLTRAGYVALLVALLWLMGMAWWARLRGLRLAALGGLVWMLGIVVALAWANPILGLRLRGESDRVWYQARYAAPPTVTVQAGQVVTVTVQVRNEGVRTWTPEGEFAFALSYHLSREDGTSVSYDGLRSPLPRPVAPGEEVQVQARIQAPPDAGRYRVEWDMVQEAVTWFSWKGTPPAITWLEVAPAATPPPVVLPPTGPPRDVRLTVPAPGRLTLWRAGWRMVQAHPLLGVGPDNFRLVYGRYAGVAEWDRAIHANSIYVEWLADTGVLGFGAFLLSLGCLGWHVGRGLRRVNRLASRERGWLLAGSAVLVVWFVHGVLDSFYEFLPTLIPFWMVVGLSVRLGDEAGEGQEIPCGSAST